jgi:hypothetical protein
MMTMMMMTKYMTGCLCLLLIYCIKVHTIDTIGVFAGDNYSNDNIENNNNDSNDIAVSLERENQNRVYVRAANCHRHYTHYKTGRHRSCHHYVHNVDGDDDDDDDNNRIVQNTTLTVPQSSRYRKLFSNTDHATYSRCKDERTIPQPIPLDTVIKMYGVKKQLSGIFLSNVNRRNNTTPTIDSNNSNSNTISGTDDDRKREDTNHQVFDTEAFQSFQDLCKLKVDSVFAGHDLLVNDCGSTKKSLQFSIIPVGRQGKRKLLNDGSRGVAITLSSGMIIMLQRASSQHYLYRANPLFGQEHTVRLEKHKSRKKATSSDKVKFIVHKDYRYSFNTMSHDSQIYYGDVFNLYPYVDNKKNKCVSDEKKCVDRVRCGGSTHKVLDVIHLNSMCCTRTNYDNRCGKGPRLVLMVFQYYLLVAP